MEETADAEGGSEPLGSSECVEEINKLKDYGTVEKNPDDGLFGEISEKLGRRRFVGTHADTTISGCHIHQRSVRIPEFIPNES